jgi:hypothetical protein
MSFRIVLSSQDQMRNSEIRLSMTGMKSITNDIPHDFTFIADLRSFKCHRIVARVIGPNVSLLHLIDPSISEYIVETKDFDKHFH